MLARAPSPARRRAAGVAFAALLAVATGCSRNEFEDRTAVLVVGGESTTLEVDSCGLDGTTVFVVGRGPGGVVVQAVVGVEDDERTGIPASTGLTVDGASWANEAPNSGVLADSYGASGAESWSRRGQSGRAPGSITSAVIRGSRIQVAGRLEPLTPEGTVVPGPASDVPRIPFRLDARCDEAGS